MIKHFESSLFLWVMMYVRNSFSIYECMQREMRMEYNKLILVDSSFFSRSQFYLDFFFIISFFSFFHFFPSSSPCRFGSVE